MEGQYASVLVPSTEKSPDVWAATEGKYTCILTLFLPVSSRRPEVCAAMEGKYSLILAPVAARKPEVCAAMEDKYACILSVMVIMDGKGVYVYDV